MTRKVSILGLVVGGFIAVPIAQQPAEKLDYAAIAQICDGGSRARRRWRRCSG